MGRRSTPERIQPARRAAMLARLTQIGRKSPETAEALVAAWEPEADGRGKPPVALPSTARDGERSGTPLQCCVAS
jgi:hypothetical protein